MEKFLNNEIETQLTEIFKQLTNPVSVLLFIDNNGCNTCSETNQLFSEVSSLSNKITLKIADIKSDLAQKYNIKLVPSFVILDMNDNNHGMIYNGIPAGHEFATFIEGIIDASNTKTDFDDTLIEEIKKIDKKVHIKVFVTLGCMHCPGAVITARKLASLNPNITAESIEAQTFQELSIKYNVSGVPKIVFNETKELLGNQPVNEFIKIISTL